MRTRYVGGFVTKDSITSNTGIWTLNTIIPRMSSALFTMSTGVTYTLRPMTFGSYGMNQTRWETVFSAISAPWFSSRNSGVALSAVVSHYNNPQESNRGNPTPSGIFSVTGWPAGVYEFTLHGGAGADADPGFGAPGGSGVGRIMLSPSSIIYFTVGQGGIYTGSADRSTHAPWYYPNPGGWNGGGAAGAQGSANMYSGSGGGSTDIRLNGIALADRIMIAGGGGGATDQNYMTGGAGGGFNQNGERGGNNGYPDGAGQGGTQSAGGSGAKKGGTVLESYMNGALWSGGAGFDGSGGSINSRNAAGGGGGGYYGGGGAVDEINPDAGGAGGGSGYANTSIVSVQSSSVGGAANGNPSWTNSNSSVNGSGHSLVDYDGSTFTPSSTNSSNATYTSYRGDGTKTHINSRYGRNGLISVRRIS